MKETVLASASINSIEEGSKKQQAIYPWKNNN